MEAEDLIRQLETKRVKLNLTTKAVAFAAEFSGSNVTKWELLHHLPRLDLFVAWADVLGYDVVLKPQRGPKK